MKHLKNVVQTPFNYSWNTHKTSLKHIYKVLETHFDFPWNTTKTSLKPLLIFFYTQTWKKAWMCGHCPWKFFRIVESSGLWKNIYSYYGIKPYKLWKFLFKYLTFSIFVAYECSLHLNCSLTMTTDIDNSQWQLTIIRIVGNDWLIDGPHVVPRDTLSPGACSLRGRLSAGHVVSRGRLSLVQVVSGADSLRGGLSRGILSPGPIVSGADCLGHIVLLVDCLGADCLGAPRPSTQLT